MSERDLVANIIYMALEEAKLRLYQPPEKESVAARGRRTRRAEAVAEAERFFHTREQTQPGEVGCHFEHYAHYLGIDPEVVRERLGEVRVWKEEEDD